MDKSILEIDELVKKIVSQTTYDVETSKQKLKEFNNDYIKIRFLHQLQNLFWCLSGKELEVKL